MKRAILAVAIAALVGTGVYGLAASLNVSSGTLGAGSATVAACQSATINVTYDTSYSASQPGYQATTVHLQHVDQTTCGGKAYSVTLADGSNAVLGSSATGNITTGSNTDYTQNVTITGVNVTSVANVHVSIAG